VLKILECAYLDRLYKCTHVVCTRLRGLFRLKYMYIIKIFTNLLMKVYLKNVFNNRCILVLFIIIIDILLQPEHT